MNVEKWIALHHYAASGSTVRSVCKRQMLVQRCHAFLPLHNLFDAASIAITKKGKTPLRLKIRLLHLFMKYQDILFLYGTINELVDSNHCSE